MEDSIPLVWFSDSKRTVLPVKYYAEGASEAKSYTSSLHLPYEMKFDTPSFGRVFQTHVRPNPRDSSIFRYDDYTRMVKPGMVPSDLPLSPSGNGVIIADLRDEYINIYPYFEISLEEWMTNLRFRRLNRTYSSWQIDCSVDGST